MQGASDAASMLGSVPFFSSLDEKRRRSLAFDGKVMSYNAGDIVVGEGTTGVGFYLVLDGRAEV